MKTRRWPLAALITVATCAPSFAQTAPAPATAHSPMPAAKLPPGVVVRQGDVSLTLNDIDGRIAQIPPDKRAGFMDDPERIEQTLRADLLQRRMAQQAIELGMADDPVVQAEIDQARTEILARRRLARFLKSLPTPNVEALAEEAYLADPKAYSTPDLYDVRHLLVTYRAHGVDAARDKVTKLRAQFLADGGEFADFVKAHSEEEGAKEVGGLIEDVKVGDTEKDFEVAMLALKPGELSEPVRTKYGFHLIQLVDKTPGKRLPFEDVKPAIIERLSQDFKARERDGLFGRLRSEALEADPALVASLRTRYLPEGEGQKAIAASEQPKPGEYERYATSVSAPARGE